MHWTAADRDKAIWWQLRENATCPSCGTRPEEWDEKQGGDKNAYKAEIHWCRGCEVRARTESAPELQSDRRGGQVRMRQTEKKGQT